MEPQKISSTVFDPVSENFKNLVALFPSVIKDGQVDFEALKAELGEFEEVGKERYELTWAGKQQAKKVAAEGVSGRTLKYVPEESKCPESTENLYIEGDNLEVLKLLQNSYMGKIKMIYIDPPYNTGNDFIYCDKFRETKGEYEKQSGQRDENDNPLVLNPETSGRFHAKWLSMIYPRLRHAKNLLSDDGVLVIHIDEHEYVNLEKILSELFGDENNLGTIIWDKRNPKGDSKGIAYQHEYISFFCKNKEIFTNSCEFKRPKENAKKMLKKVDQLIQEEGIINENVRDKYKNWLKNQDFSAGEKAYNLIDEEGKVYRPVSMAWPNKNKAPDEYFIPLIHPVTKKPCPIPERGWRNPPQTMSELINKGLILFGTDELTQPTRKYLLEENLDENVSSLLYYGGSDDTLLSELGIIFDNPKVVSVSKKIILPICKMGDIILDFFSGSATIAHAVMQLNAEDNGNRKYIMVQYPEQLDDTEKRERENKEAIIFCDGLNVPRTISEIGKERIRRAGEKIKRESGDNAENLDIGFKVFKTSDTNIRWIAEENGMDISQTHLDNSLLSSKDRRDFMPDATDIDVVYEILLRQYDIPLSTKMENLSDIGQRTYIFANVVVVCLEEEISKEIIDKIAAIEPMPHKIIFRDTAFGKDISLKLNTMERFNAMMKKHSDTTKQPYVVEFL